MKLTKEYILKHLRYNKDQRKFYWRSSTPSHKSGTLAGAITKDGEQMIPLAGKTLQAAAVVWFWKHGVLHDWDMSYRDGNPRNIHLRNIYPKPKPVRVRKVERKAIAGWELVTKESLKRKIHDWLVLDAGENVFRWKFTFGGCKKGAIAGSHVNPKAKDRYLTYYDEKRNRRRITYTKLAWLWYYGEWPEKQVWRIEKTQGLWKDNLTQDSKEILRAARAKKVRPDDTLVFRNAPTTKHCRAEHSKFRYATVDDRKKHGYKRYNAWAIAAAFEKALRTFGGEYVDAVLAIENQPYYKSNK